MSRRHKITTQEVHQVAEETSEHILRRLDLAMPFIEMSCVRLVSRDGLRHLNVHINDIIKNALTDSFEQTFIKRLSSYIDIVDAPEEQFSDTRKRGRPKILQLFDRFRDTDVIKMLKTSYFELFHKTIEKAKDIIDHVICFLQAMCEREDDDCYGKISHYHEMLKRNLSCVALPTVRTLQNKFNKFKELASGWKKNIKNAMKEKEECLFKKWMRLKGQYLSEIEILAPAYAI